MVDFIVFPGTSGLLDIRNSILVHYGKFYNISESRGAVVPTERITSISGNPVNFGNMLLILEEIPWESLCRLVL
jgi:hypothetical protein